MSEVQGRHAEGRKFHGRRRRLRLRKGGARPDRRRDRRGAGQRGRVHRRRARPPMPSTPRACRSPRPIIDALDNCKVITLGSVGVDSVDVKAATARGIPVTNIPDTFIEEVADHAMMLLLAGFRRLVEQDKMVREGRWAEGRPALLKIPRLMGQTLGFISFGRVARAVAKRAAPVRPAHDGLRSLHPGDADLRPRRDAGDAVGGVVAIRFRVDARAGAAGSASHARRRRISGR